MNESDEQVETNKVKNVFKIFFGSKAKPKYSATISPQEMQQEPTKPDWIVRSEETPRHPPVNQTQTYAPFSTRPGKILNEHASNEAANRIKSQVNAEKKQKEINYMRGALDTGRS